MAHDLTDCKTFFVPPAARAGAKAPQPLYDWLQALRWGVLVLEGFPAFPRDVVMRTCDPPVVVKTKPLYAGDKVYARISDHPIVARTYPGQVINAQGLCGFNNETNKWTAFALDSAVPTTTQGDALWTHEWFHALDLGRQLLHGLRFSDYPGFVDVYTRYNGAAVAGNRLEAFAVWGGMAHLDMPHFKQTSPELAAKYQGLLDGTGWT